MKKLLEVKDLKVSFHTYAGEVQAVRGVSFELNEGETLAIVGESGSGKTVAAKTIMGLIAKPAGEVKKESQILFEGKNVLEYNEKKWQGFRGKDAGMIFQDPMTSLNPTMKIGQQIAEGIIKHSKVSRKEAMEQATELLRQVNIPNPEERIKQFPHELSGGMRQRVVIAIALACNPKVMIADEPTTALDVTIQAQIIELLQKMQKENNSSIIMITHDLGVVAGMADKIAVMYAGKMVEQGTVYEIFKEPNHPYTYALLNSVPKLDVKNKEKLHVIPGTPPDLVAPPKGCGFASRCKHCMEICKQKEPEITLLSDNHKSFCWLNHELADAVSQEKNVEVSSEDSIKHELKDVPLVRVHNLKKHFTLKKNTVLKAVDGVSLDIFEGETVGLVGESGCGKTTCGRTILGIYEATEGEIEFDGKKLSDFKTKEEKLWFKKNVQMIFQDPYASLNPRMTVGEIVAEGIDNHKLYVGEARKNRIYEVLELVGLSKEHANRFPHEFSGGQRQRIGIARALAVEPKFIVCDEPISALDVSIQAQVVNLLIKLQKEFSLTYLFIAHDLSMVKHISDRVGVMYMGQLAELASSEDLYSKPLHPYTTSLLSAIPVPDPETERNKKVIPLSGEVSSPINCGPGCRFASRCEKAMDICNNTTPILQEVQEKHFVACHLFNQEKKHKS